MRNAPALEQIDARLDFITDDAEPFSQRARASHVKPIKDVWATEEALTLVQRLSAVQGAGVPQVVLFADVDQSGSSGRLAVSVAETLGRTSSKATCLVDADLRAPALSGMLGLQGAEGLTDALSSEAPLRAFVQPLSHPKLWFLSGGAARADSARLLTSERFRERMDELRKAFDYVVINTSPLGLYSDAIAIGQLSDGLVLTLKAGTTRRESAQSAATKLRAAHVPILGAVLTDRTFPIPEKIYRKL